MIKRSIIVLSLLLLPVGAFAQSNELGVFVSTTQFDDRQIRDGLDTLDVKFDEDMGYGVLYNRYWGSAFSTEFAYQKLGADLTVSFEDIVDQAGTLDLDMLSATGQFHLMRGSLISPYVGGGVAYVSGKSGAIDRSELENADLEKELDWLANAGVNLNLGRFAIFVDGKYVWYEARGEGTDNGQGLDINPLIISGGVKLKF